MRVGILGSGFMGATHAHAFAKQPDVQIVAVSSRSQSKAEKLATEVGAAATIDNMAIVNDPSIDAISVTLPTHLHVEYTISALRSGKHVLLEKPFGLTVDDCDQIMAVEATTDKHLMLAHVLRFWPDTKYWLRWSEVANLANRWRRWQLGSQFFLAGRPGSLTRPSAAVQF